MVMLLPGLGETGVPSQIRLAIALILCFVLFPLHRDAFAIDLRSFGPVTLGLGRELLIGAVLGLTTRLTVSARCSRVRPPDCFALACSSQHRS